MAKIIEHNFINGRQTGTDHLTGSFSSFMQELEDKKALLGEMVIQARLFLSAEGMNPSEFILSDSYLREFLCTSLEEQGQYAEIVYLNVSKETITALCQFAVPEAGDFTLSYQIYSLDPDKEDSRRWRLYNFQTRDWIPDEEDCFDTKTLLGEYRRFFRGSLEKGAGDEGKNKGRDTDRGKGRGKDRSGHKEIQD